MSDRRVGDEVFRTDMGDSSDEDSTESDFGEQVEGTKERLRKMRKRREELVERERELREHTQQIRERLDRDDE